MAATPRPRQLRLLIVLGLFVGTLVGCAVPAGDPGGATPPPAPALSPIPSPTAAPSPTPLPTPAATAALDSGVEFLLDPASEQAMVVVVTDMIYNSVLEGPLDRGETLSAPLPPGEYRYRAAQIFEPLEPTACYQSVDEGTFTIGDTPQPITLFNGVIPDCSSP